MIPVVDNGRPVGLVERNAFLLKIASPLGHAQYANRPVIHVMDPEPAVVEAGVSIDAFCDVLLKGGPAERRRFLDDTLVARKLADIPIVEVPMAQPPASSPTPASSAAASIAR